MIRGWIYSYLWYTSILAGYAILFCPIFPLILVSNKLYRHVSDVLFTFWQYYPTALLEFMCDCDVQVSGDPIIAGETSLIVMNHRTRTDWNFLWPAVYHCVQGRWRLFHSTKFVLKEIIRHIPGPGWVMQLACFTFIRRNWREDIKTFKKYIDYVTEMNYKFSLILFPEEEHNLQKYDYVLQPRTTGFTYITSKMLEKKILDAIYDVTIIYPDKIPQNEKMLFNGIFPKQVFIHFVRYSSSLLPKDQVNLKKFLENRWSDKEKAIKEFMVSGQFLHGNILKNNRKYELYFALIFWTSLPFLALYFFLYIWQFRLWVIFHSIMLIVINFFFDGFQMFEIDLYNSKKG